LRAQDRQRDDAESDRAEDQFLMCAHRLRAAAHRLIGGKFVP
jgi:hypothetical protein